MIPFDEQLRTRVRENLAVHQRREVPVGDRRAAAVAVVLVDSDADRHDGALVEGPLAGRMSGVAGGAAFLLCRRPARMRRHPGQWALPGGRVDPGETALETAMRELDEELGIRLSPDAMVGRLDDYVSRSGHHITPVVLWAGADPPITPAPDEVAAVFRVGLAALSASEPRFLDIPESDRPVLQLPLGDDRIHAPTAALLLQFRLVGLEGRAGERVDHYEEPVFAWR